MKFIVAILAVVAVVAAQDLYTNKYDNIDVDEILKSDRLFKNYYQCLTEEGRCTSEGNELKRILPEALETNCAKCSTKQRATAVKAFGYLSVNRAEEWKTLRTKFDPEGKYIEQYREEAEKNGIKL
ncbi:ejaculatory bulb-specific protein 3-like [Toxorhynchites rutilus septentrionalis]|uniref:ejaculatory bulb-specific protein 3-like n=1 Tax=Toxorhynchites rutilus septentrionalis TaxID=329112 RepID=UPI0024790992|nr:ejaculatory bulb-specific protein 3-like [Toxorhynchites rutilus septentrionalis]